MGVGVLSWMLSLPGLESLMARHVSKVRGRLAGLLGQVLVRPCLKLCQKNLYCTCEFVDFIYFYPLERIPFVVCSGEFMSKVELTDR